MASNSSHQRGGISFSQNAETVYDPDQDPDDKRQVRRNYRQLNKDYEGPLDHNEHTVEQLAGKVKAADDLFTRVKGPQEATLDSAFLLRASGVGAQKARAMKSATGAFDVDDFLAKLVTFMGGRRQLLANDEADSDLDADIEEDDAFLQWDKMGRRAMAHSRRVPATDFMLGPLAIEHKQRTVAKRAKLVKDANDERKPEQIREEDIQRSDNETSKNVAVLEGILRTMDDPVNMFQFFIHPDDFGQSVENLFHLSFLIRDGQCAMMIDEETAEPTIQLVEPPTHQDYEEGLRKQQIVMEFDMETWKHAIEVFDIRQPMIPTRKVARTNLGQRGWKG